MIDLHTHILPGIDDGPPTLEEAVALARDTVAAGVDRIVATPHVSARYPNDPETVHAALRSLRQALDRAGVPLAVDAGAELDLERAVSLPDGELNRLRLNAGRYLLIECPLSPVAGDIEPLVGVLQRRGHDIVLAHPERSPGFHRDPGQIERLVASGALVSVTAGAVAGDFGERARALALHLLQAGLVHNLVSDMHDRVGRPPGILANLGEAGVAALEPGLGWLTEVVPAAVLDGDPIPPGPALGGPRRPLSRRWRRRRR